ncbi:PREDICTED: chitin elicitor-binding protein-like [Nelumbo nucifera]|uniref:Chitin elicitor-binding protein-like n=1 Tax=Nelumbo nucifera TaxID=4432 RepID=A0A1U7ZGI0_NELNU|nr:PREDICTED: chitin elicitor-binding protein-like [Nelumbo nucifera]
MASYRAPNKTTLGSIQMLFGVENLSSLLGANSIPLFTSSNQTVAAGEMIKIPFYGSSLEKIARESWVTEYSLMTANGISNSGDVREGQVPDIPLQVSMPPVSAPAPASSFLHGESTSLYNAPQPIPIYRALVSLLQLQLYPV